MPKMGLNVLSLSEVELLHVLTLNLCGVDPGLEAGSKLAIKSNLVIYLVPYILGYHILRSCLLTCFFYIFIIK